MPATLSPPIVRDQWRLRAAQAPELQLQRQAARQPLGIDVVYVHGATFGADLSVFHRFDGRSWADALNEAGLDVWGFDFAGYGASQRYGGDAPAPWGRLDAAAAQLGRVMAAVRATGAGRPPVLLAHSWGTLVASRLAAQAPDDVAALVLFGPIARRAPPRAGPPPPKGPEGPKGPAAAFHVVSAWAQYRRFVADVPPGEPQVLDEAHFEAWAADYLASDPGSATRQPPSVCVPAGPLADLAALWSGQTLVELGRVRAPTLIVRGAWDACSTDADAATLLAELGAMVKRDTVIPRATHLMHLEAGRHALYAEVNRFLLQTLFQPGAST